MEKTKRMWDNLHMYKTAFLNSPVGQHSLVFRGALEAASVPHGGICFYKHKQ